MLVHLKGKLKVQKNKIKRILVHRKFKTKLIKKWIFKTLAHLPICFIVIHWPNLKVAIPIVQLHLNRLIIHLIYRNSPSKINLEKQVQFTFRRVNKNEIKWYLEGFKETVLHYLSDWTYIPKGENEIMNKFLTIFYRRSKANHRLITLNPLQKVIVTTINISS